MSIGKVIHRIRNEAKLTQAQFSEIFGVSQQSVQKWESGIATPDLDKIVKISKYFGISLDALVLENDSRVVEEMKRTAPIKPSYEGVDDGELYSSNLMIEYRQSVEEGLDIQRLEDIFCAVSMLPKGELKKKFGDVLYDAVSSAGQVEGYPHVEPSGLEQIRQLRKSGGGP